MTASIVGWAHTPFGKFDTETVESLVVRVAVDALADAAGRTKPRIRKRPGQGPKCLDTEPRTRWRTRFMLLSGCSGRSKQGRKLLR